MDWWFDIVGPVWIVLAAIGICLAVIFWAAEAAPEGTRAREQEIQVGAIIFLAALLAPLSVVVLVIYGLVWLVRTALGK